MSRWTPSEYCLCQDGLPVSTAYVKMDSQCVLLMSRWTPTVYCLCQDGLPVSIAYVHVKFVFSPKLVAYGRASSVKKYSKLFRLKNIRNSFI